MSQKCTWVIFPVLLVFLCYILFMGGQNEGNVIRDKNTINDPLVKTASAGNHNNHPLEDSYCCCTTDEIQSGTEAIASLLNNITSRPFFRFFKVNVEKPCPYWAVQLLCTSEENSCQVCSCDANDVPEALKYPHDMSDPSVVESRVSYGGEKPTNVDMWGAWKDTDSEASYVDLLQNPEGNTGYSGPMASRVWQAIYKENCMTEVSQEGDSTTVGQCKEVQVFRKLISGLHTSITMHVATFFHKDKEGKSPLLSLGVLKNPNISFFPNCGMFQRIVKSQEYIENLYVLYQFILRALTKAKNVFLSDLNSFNSGTGGKATDEDKELHKELQELFGEYLLCSSTFNEARFLESPTARELIPQMNRMMLNITTLMDCVACEKCRVWGKLQTMGLATAFKIVMFSSSDSLKLSRGEEVSLVNFARQLAVAVKSLHSLPGVCKQLETAEKS
ncbi:Endoplasmic reticulum oxidoreductin 1 [Trypanosoma melophagium]|uniref:Endoplasmic reticulum oxidoreductin 1 n=1 Tax=Trypanosoma melophagium TaxID=715481 RepID=UPI003519E87F|nr:Endoplasmic reticulum oxidoreductin 1 [Trypanosoma melophagium]